MSFPRALIFAMKRLIFAKKFTEWNDFVILSLVCAQNDIFFKERNFAQVILLDTADTDYFLQTGFHG